MKQEALFAERQDGGGGEGEILAGAAEAPGGIAVGLDVLGGRADVGPERAGDEDAGDAVAPGLRAAVGGDERVEAFRRDEREDARIEQLQAAERGVVRGGIVEVADDAVLAADGLGAGVRGQPAGGEGLLFLPGAEQRRGIDVGDDVGVEQPERFVDEPAGVAEGAAGAEDVGLEDGGDAQRRERLGLEIVDDGPGRVVEVDQDLLDAPAGEHGEGAGEHGFAPERQHGLGRFERQWPQAGAEAGGEDKGFARDVHGGKR